MIIIRALCGFNSSGAMRHNIFSDNLRDMGFWTCYDDFNIWMRERGDQYKYVAAIVDYLLIISKNP